MPEELLVRDHYSSIVEAEVRFKVNRELDQMEEDLLKKEVLGMLIRVGSVLYAGQLKKEREL